MWADRVKTSRKPEFVRRALRWMKTTGHLDSLAWIHYRRGEFKEALKIQLKALEHSEEPDPEILMHLGEIYIALDDPKRPKNISNKLTLSKILPTTSKPKLRQTEGLK